MISARMIKATKPFIAIVICWLFYIFAFFARVEPSVLVDDLMRDFSLNASQIGTIVSILYIPYVAMQIPWGILVDKLGCKLIISLCCAMCSVGVLIFGVATASWQLVVARILIGFSSSAAYLSCGKVISETLPKKKYSMLMGITFFIGSMGGVFGTTATATLANHFGWRNLTFAMAIVGFIIASFAFVFLQDRQKNQSVEKENVLEGLKLLVKNPTCWLIGIVGCAINLPVSAVAELWGTHFIQTRFNVSTAEASICASTMFITGGIGCILSAKIAEKLNSNKKTVILFSIGMALTFAIAVYCNSINFISCVVLFGLASIFSGAGILIFEMMYKLVPKKYAGTSVGYTDAFIMSGGIIFQPILGRLLDFFRDGKVNPDGMPLYDIVMYRNAFTCILAVIVISIIIMAFVKEEKLYLQFNK